MGDIFDLTMPGFRACDCLFGPPDFMQENSDSDAWILWRRCDTRRRSLSETRRERLKWTQELAIIRSFPYDQSFKACVFGSYEKKKAEDTPMA